MVTESIYQQHGSTWCSESGHRHNINGGEGGGGGLSIMYMHHMCVSQTLFLNCL